MSRERHLISATGLARELGQASPPVVLDVRWRLGEAAGAGRQRFEAGHIPGSVHADLETVFTRHAGVATDGRHPLPDPGELSTKLAALGVDPARRVVVVDEPGSFAAERSWWVLRWVGIDARVLDGGIPAWRQSGLPLETGASRPNPVPSCTLRPGQLPTVTVDGASEVSTDPSRTLIDARAAERFRGETEPIDPVAGHIPGAVNIPVPQFYDDRGQLPNDATLTRLLQPGAHPSPTVYCGSGVSAAREVLAFAVLGIDASLFAGSWSAWCNDPTRPVATGNRDEADPLSD